MSGNWRIVWSLVLSVIVAVPGLCLQFCPPQDGNAGGLSDDVAGAARTTPAPAPSALPSFGSPGGFFTRNDGQFPDGRVRYLHSSNGFEAAFQDSAVLLTFRSGGPDGPESSLQITFPGSNLVAPEGRERLGHPSHYLLGSDPSGWRLDVPSFARVVYEGLYEGIDLVYYLNDRGLKYDWVVAPGADPGAVAELFGGARSVASRPDGRLEVRTAGPPLVLPAPFCYQTVDGIPIPVAASFAADGLSAGYRLGPYDRARELVIDPLLYSTFLGSDGKEQGTGIAVDQNGMAYVTGWTYSSGFPATNGSYDRSHNGGEDVFVSKLNADGSYLQWSTFVGGSGDDGGTYIAVLDNGDLAVSGYSNSSDFPTTNGTYDSSQNGGRDIVLFVLSSDGSKLRRSTYFGGSGDDNGRLAVDQYGDFILSGQTTSSDFPTTSGAYDTSHNGGEDVFVARLWENLTGLGFSTYVGSSGGEYGSAPALDGSANIYVAGYTNSSGFPTTSGCYQGSKSSGEDAFVFRLSMNGTNLSASTFIGHTSDDRGTAVLAGSGGEVFVTGYTYSSGFPVTAGAYDNSSNGNADAFVCLFNSGLSSLGAATFLGGSSDDYATSLLLDANGTLCGCGWTASSDFPVFNRSYDSSSNGNRDACLFQMKADLSSLLNSTYLGGSGLDEGAVVALGPLDDVFLTGRVESSGFPTTSGAYDTAYNSNRDCFALRLHFSGAPAPEEPFNDSDNDGVADSKDAFPFNPYEYVDTDGDGMGDNLDPDADNDGVPDERDAFMLDAAESADTDGDGIGDNADKDDDGDGVPDSRDAFPKNPREYLDSDGDGIGDWLDVDDDNDNLTDQREFELYLGSMFGSLNWTLNSLIQNLSSHVGNLSAAELRELQKAFNALTADLLAVQADLEAFSGETGTALSGMLSSLSQRLDGVNRTLQARLAYQEQLSAENRDRLSREIADLLDALEMAEANLSYENEDLSGAVSALSGLTRELSARELDETGRRLQSLSGNLSGVDRSLSERLAALGANLSAAAAAQKADTDEIDKALQDLAKLDSVLDDLESTRAGLAEGDKKTRDAVSAGSDRNAGLANLNTALMVVVLVLVVAVAVLLFRQRPPKAPAGPEA
jgi:hypothetical protein